MTGSATVQASASTVSGTIVPSVTTVSANTTYQINITTLDALSATGQVKIIFPTTISPTTTSNCATLSGTNVITSPTCAVSGADNSVLITAMNSSTADIVVQTLTVNVLGVVNAPSTAPSADFRVQTYYTGDADTLVADGTISGISATVGTIDNSKVGVVATSYVVLDTAVTYTLSFTNTY